MTDERHKHAADTLAKKRFLSTLGALALVGASIVRRPSVSSSLALLMISFISAAGRISIVPHCNFTPGHWEMSLNCVIQISRFKHLNSTQLLLVPRTDRLSLQPFRSSTHGHRRVGGLRGSSATKCPVLPQFVVVAKTLVQHGVASL